MSSQGHENYVFIVYVTCTISLTHTRTTSPLYLSFSTLHKVLTLFLYMVRSATNIKFLKINIGNTLSLIPPSYCHLPIQSTPTPKKKTKKTVPIYTPKHKSASHNTTPTSTPKKKSASHNTTPTSPGTTSKRAAKHPVDEVSL